MVKHNCNVAEEAVAEELSPYKELFTKVVWYLIKIMEQLLHHVIVFTTAANLVTTDGSNSIAKCRIWVIGNSGNGNRKWKQKQSKLDAK